MIELVACLSVVGFVAVALAITTVVVDAYRTEAYGWECQRCGARNPTRRINCRDCGSRHIETSTRAQAPAMVRERNSRPGVGPGPKVRVPLSAACGGQSCNVGR